MYISEISVDVSSNLLSSNDILVYLDRVPKSLKVMNNLRLIEP